MPAAIASRMMGLLNFTFQVSSEPVIVEWRDKPVDMDFSGFFGKLLFPNGHLKDKISVTFGWGRSRSGVSGPGMGPERSFVNDRLPVACSSRRILFSAIHHYVS